MEDVKKGDVVVQSVTPRSQSVKSAAAPEKKMGFLGKVITQITPVKFFVIMAVVFGFIFMAVTPPFQTPDEPVHFMRAYQISEFNFVVDPIKGGYGGSLPSSLGKTITLTTTNPTISFYANEKYNIYNTRTALHTPLNPSNQASYNFASTASYSPIAYIPQSTAILIGRLLKLPPILLMYLGRTGNLFAWVILFGLSIMLIPRKKWATVFVGLLPMALFQAISESADVMSIGLAALFVAYVLHLVDRKKVITPWQLVALLLIGTGLALTKEVMFIFLILVLLIPWKLFVTKRKAILTKAALIVIPLVALGLWMFVTRHISNASTTVAGVNAKDQIKFILRSPYSYVNVLWNTYFFSWGDSIVRSLIGTFGWADTPLAIWIVVVGYLGLLFTFLVNVTGTRLKPWLTKRQKLVTIVAIVGYWLAVNTALYVYYSPVGFKILYGVQGRYFLPLLLPLIPLLYGDWLRSSKRLYRRVAIYVPLFLLVASVITIYIRFYVNNV